MHRRLGVEEVDVIEDCAALGAVFHDPEGWQAMHGHGRQGPKSIEILFDLGHIGVEKVSNPDRKHRHAGAFGGICLAAHHHVRSVHQGALRGRAEYCWPEKAQTAHCVVLVRIIEVREARVLAAPLNARVNQQLHAVDAGVSGHDKMLQRRATLLHPGLSGLKQIDIQATQKNGRHSVYGYVHLI